MTYHSEKSFSALSLIKTKHRNRVVVNALTRFFRNFIELTFSKYGIKRTAANFSLSGTLLMRNAYCCLNRILFVNLLCFFIAGIQWNSVNKSTSGQPVLDLIRGGFNKRRFLKCTKCSIFSVFSSD